MHLLFWLSLWASVATAESGACPDIDRSVPVERIGYSGLEHTALGIVSRHILQRPGSNFDCALWEREQTALEGLDLFASIDVTAEQSSAGTVLTYVFVELPQFVIFPAVKATDQHGWRLGPGASMLNFLGQDIRLDFYVRTTVLPDPFLATEYMLFGGSPWTGDLPLEWELLLVHTDSFNPLLQYDESSFSFELDLYQRTQLPLQFLYRAEIYTVAHDEVALEFDAGDGFAHSLFVGKSGRDTIPSLGLGLVSDTREKRFNPHFGAYVELSVAQFGGFLGGPADYQELLADFRGYVPLVTRHILVLSALGQYRPGTMGAYDFFFVGGSNTMRAYANDVSNYGQHEVLTTAEYRLEFFEREQVEIWGDTIFYGLQWVLGSDAAMLWRPRVEEPNVLLSVYTGFHVLLPGIDRFRVEVGVYDFDRGIERLSYGISMGLFEKMTMQRQRVR